MKKNQMTAKTSLEWKAERNLLQRAGDEAEEILKVLGLSDLPIAPFAIAGSERRLKLIQGDFRNRFDGQIEYYRDKRRFLLFLNTKYDRNALEGTRHPRTRFSLSHELGHLYLERHAAYLTGGGRPHGSKGEFDRTTLVEREADAFAAGLLMPSDPFRSRLNQEEPTLDVVEELSNTFGTSHVSTLFRAVQLSHYPCAAIGIKEGQLAWAFVSDPLIDAKCYPPSRGLLQSPTARKAWESFAGGDFDRSTADSDMGRWFRTYDKEALDQVYVSEEYLPVPAMSTLVALLSVSEQELMDADGDDEEESDED